MTRKLVCAISCMVAIVGIVGLYVTPCPAAPAPQSTAPITIQAGSGQSLLDAIQSAIQTGKTTLVVPPGVYRLSAIPGYSWHLHIANARNLHIVASGVTLLLDTRSAGGVLIENCSNVSLTGVKIMHERPPFSQGKVIEKADDGLSCLLRIDQGYPFDGSDPTDVMKGPSSFYPFDAETLCWKDQCGDIWVPQVDLVSPGLYRLSWPKQDDDTRRLSVGDLMAVRIPGESSIGVFDCDHVHISGVTISNGAGAGVLEKEGDGYNTYTYRIVRAPVPPGAVRAPLLSECADGFHSAAVRHGPTLENCYFEYMGDDGIAIHGIYYLVDRSDDQGLVLGSFWNEAIFQPGDVVRIYNSGITTATTAKVLGIVPLPDYRPSQTTARAPYAGKTLHYFRLTLDKPVACDFDGRITNVSACGSGFVIRNCTIVANRARGILLKASDGVVENNNVLGSTMCGIVLAPEFSWSEADYCSNVILRNNLIRHTGYYGAGANCHQAGALSIMSDGQYQGNTNILINKNRFEDIAGCNIQVEAASGVTIKSNVFKYAHQRESLQGRDYGIDPLALVWIGNSQNVDVQDVPPAQISHAAH